MRYILYIDDTEIECLWHRLEISSSIEHAPRLTLEIETHLLFPPYGPAFLFCYGHDKEAWFCYKYEFYIYNTENRKSNYYIQGTQIGEEFPNSFLLKYHDLLLTLNCHPAYTQAEYVQLCTSERIQKIENSDLVL
jgi:hypothetical protein